MSLPRCTIRLANRTCPRQADHLYGSLYVCGLHRDALVGALSALAEDDPGVVRSLASRAHREEVERLHAQVETLKAQLVARHVAGLRELADQDRRIEEERALRHAESVIYYVEREGYIKIGVTRSLAKRMAMLERGGVLRPDGMSNGPVELLASHPGDAEVEAAIHRRFAHLRVVGEWFTKGDDLTIWIAEKLARVA